MGVFCSLESMLTLGLTGTLSLASHRGGPGSSPGSSNVGFVVNKVALREVLSEYFGYPANVHSTDCSAITIIYHLGLV
jgi:hypothetical protein